MTDKKWFIEEGTLGEADVWAVVREDDIIALCPSESAAEKVAAAMNTRKPYGETLH